MKEIKLKNSELVALVDDEMYEELNKYEWRACQAWGNSYRATTGHDIFMHHLVIGKPEPSLVTDHIDRNPLNNQRKNLRFVSKSENGFNSKTRADNTSGRKGISWNKLVGKWRAYIHINKKEKHLGYFSTVDEAVMAREKAEKERLPIL